MRPAVDVVVPFGGRDVRPVLSRIASLRLGPDDTITVVDNRGSGVQDPRLVVATEVESSYYARNAGARGGTGEWIVFLDADLVAPPDHLDRLLDPPPADGVGVVAGEVLDEEADRPLAVRYAWLKRASAQAGNVALGFAATANCAVRRSAFEAMNGFREDVRSGGDADLCLRLRDAGWTVELRADAAVVHHNRRTVRAMLAQRVKHGAGAGWIDGAHPGALPARSLPGVAWWGVRRAASGAAALARRDRDGAIEGLLDGPAVLAYELGRRLPNRARRRG